VLDELGGGSHFEEDRLGNLGVLVIHGRRLRVDAERGIFKPRGKTEPRERRRLEAMADKVRWATKLTDF
jgi:hypothetical protein